MELWTTQPSDELAAYDAMRAEYDRYAAEIRLYGGEPESFDDWAGYGESLWEDL